MTVTATIEHDVSLTLDGDTMDFGTFYIDKSDFTGGDLTYSESGAITHKPAYIVSASPVTPMNFTANIPNKTACNGIGSNCGGLSLSNGGTAYVLGGGNYCDIAIKYTGEGNNFKIIPIWCRFMDVEDVALGKHEDTITIEYTAS